MKHTSWRYRRRRNPAQQREFCAAQRRRVAARWAAYRAAQQTATPSADRVVEITIRDSRRPMTILRLTQPTHSGSTKPRWRGPGDRPLCTSGLARLRAAYIA
jgi:hypothetical protein